MDTEFERCDGCTVGAVPRRPGSRDPSPLTRGDLPEVLLRRDHHLPDVVARVRRGDWLRVRRGAFVVAEALPADPYDAARQLALSRIVAVAERTTTAFAFSHTSAALLWGLPHVGEPRTHLVQRTRPGANHADDVVRHLGEVGREVARIAGLPVTSLARTAADCARHLPGSEGLVVLDAALRAGAASSEVRALLEGRGRGAARARALLSWADDGAESAGESRARAAVLALGLPAPTTQVPVRTADGWAWTDLGWEEWTLLLEYDGRTKYGAPGQDLDGGRRSAADTLLREKRREDLIRERGWRVLRLTSRDLVELDVLRRRLAAVLPARVMAGLRPRPDLAPRRTAPPAGARLR